MRVDLEVTAFFLVDFNLFVAKDDELAEALSLNGEEHETSIATT